MLVLVVLNVFKTFWLLIIISGKISCMTPFGSCEQLRVVERQTLVSE